MSNDLLIMRCKKCGILMPIAKYWGHENTSIHQKENLESFLGQHSLFCGTDSFEVLNDEQLSKRNIEYHKNRYDPENWLEQIHKGKEKKGEE